jgi:lysozyme family protein
MNDDIEAILDGVLKSEGGWVDRADDAGGPTNMGITFDTFKDFYGPGATVDDLRRITSGAAKAIYRRVYVERPGFLMVADPNLRALLVDCAVLHGPKNAVRMLQRSLGVMDDGVIGSQTLIALGRMSPVPALARANAERIMFLGRHVTGDLTDRDKDGVPDATEMAAGWFNRAARFVAQIGG